MSTISNCKCLAVRWTLVIVLAGLAFNASAAEPVDHDALMAERPARFLSEYNLFVDASRQIPNERVEPYHVTNPLFSDHADKFRFIYLPEDAAPAPYSAEGPLDFPVGSVLVKTFAYPGNSDRPGDRLRLVETRLLIHYSDGWRAWPYVWNEDMSDAHLKLAGARIPMTLRDANGEQISIDYEVPNALQCKGCHVDADGEFTPIGPKIRNLNDDREYGDGQTRNQLERLAMIGYLAGLPATPSELPRVPRSFDPEDGSLAVRARGYLDGNCAHCHSPGRPGDTSGLYLDYGEERPVHWGVWKRPVAAGRGSGGLEFDIHPGKPADSILLYRMKSDDPAIRMPELGRSTIDQKGVELVSDFIESLDPADY